MDESCLSLYTNPRIEREIPVVVNAPQKREGRNLDGFSLAGRVIRELKSEVAALHESVYNKI